MKVLPHDASDDEILGVCREWVDLVAAGRLADAIDMLHPGRRPHADVVRLSSDPRAGSVDLDTPLDGEWSDLTAQFEFAPVDGGIAISLYGLHVL